MNYEYAMFLAGMLTMGLFGSLVVLLIIRPWLKPMRRSLEANREAIQAAITAEQSRQEQAENDQLEETRRRAASRREGTDEQIEEIEEAVRVEEARARLRWVRLQNDQSLPPPWKIKRQYVKWAVILILLFILTTLASIYFSK